MTQQKCEKVTAAVRGGNPVNDFVILYCGCETTVIKEEGYITYNYVGKTLEEIKTLPGVKMP